MVRWIKAGGRTFVIRYNEWKGTYEYGPSGCKKFVAYGTDDTEAECEKRIYEEFGGQDHEKEN